MHHSSHEKPYLQKWGTKNQRAAAICQESALFGSANTLNPNCRKYLDYSRHQGANQRLQSFLQIPSYPEHTSSHQPGVLYTL